jgi:hypothetical protein
MTEGHPMNDRTNYGAVAEKIDYTKLEKKLEQLREQEPLKKRKCAGDVLAPVRDKLTELHAAVWTYAQLAEELNGAGLPVKVGTLREYLGHGGHGANTKPKRRSRKPRTVSVAAAGC